MKTFDDTLTDHELTGALRESPLAGLERPEQAEPDLGVDGLDPPLVSRIAMDSWEPSLLRRLLNAVGRLDRGGDG